MAHRDIEVRIEADTTAFVEALRAAHHAAVRIRVSLWMVVVGQRERQKAQAWWEEYLTGVYADLGWDRPEHPREVA